MSSNSIHFKYHLKFSCIVVLRAKLLSVFGRLSYVFGHATIAHDFNQLLGKLRRGCGDTAVAHQIERTA